MMSDYSRTQELVAAAYDSEGSSQAQFEKTLDSLDAKLTQLKNAWDSFTMGLANNEVIKLVVDTLTLILNIFNKVTDAFGKGTSSVMKLVAAFALFGGLSKTLPKLINEIAKSVVQGLSESGTEAGKSAGNNIVNELQKKESDVYIAGGKMGLAFRQGFEDGSTGTTSPLGQTYLNPQGGQTQPLALPAPAKDGGQQESSPNWFKDELATKQLTQYGTAIAGVGATISLFTNLLSENSDELTREGEALNEAVQGAGTALSAFGSVVTVLGALGVKLSITAPQLFLIAAAIALVVAAVAGISSYYETAAEKAERLNEEYEEQKALVEDITSAYDAYKTANNELDGLIKNSEEYNEQLKESTELALALQAASNGEIKLVYDKEAKAWKVDEQSYNNYLEKQANKEQSDQKASDVANLEAAVEPAKKGNWFTQLLGWNSYKIGETIIRDELSTEGLTGTSVELVENYNELLELLEITVRQTDAEGKVFYNYNAGVTLLTNLGYGEKNNESAEAFIERIITEQEQAIRLSNGYEQRAANLFVQDQGYVNFAADIADLTYAEATQTQKISSDEVKNFLTGQGVGEEVASFVAQQTISNFKAAYDDALSKAGISVGNMPKYQKDMTFGQLIGLQSQKEVLNRSEEKGTELSDTLDEILQKASKALSAEDFDTFADYLTSVDLSNLTELEGISTIVDDMELEWEGGQSALDNFIAEVKEAGIAIRKAFDVGQYEKAVLSNRLTVQDKIENRESTWTEDEYSTFAAIAKAAGEEEWIDKNFTQNKEGEYTFIGSFDELEAKTSGTEKGLYSNAKESLTWRSEAESQAAAAAAAITPAVAKASEGLQVAQKAYEEAIGTENESAAYGKLVSAQHWYARAVDFAGAGKDKTFLQTYGTQEDFKTAASLNMGEEGYIDNERLKGYINNFFGGLTPTEFKDLTDFTPEELTSADLDEESRKKLFDLISDYVYKTENADTLNYLETQGAFNSLNQDSTQVLNDSTISGEEKTSRLEGFIRETEGAAATLDYFVEKGAEADNTTKALAVSATKSAKKFGDFGDSIEDNIENLKNCEKGTKEYNDALTAITKAAKSAFGDDVNMDVLLSDMERLEKIADGDQDAFKSLQADIVEANSGISAALEDVGVTADELINRDWVASPTLDIAGWSGNAEDLLAKANTTRDALAQLGFESEIIYGEHGEITGVRVTSSAATGLAGRSSGGGGGGGGGSNKNWENPYDPLYNLTEKINEALREREKLEREYDRLLEDRNGNFLDIIKNTLDTMANLEEEIALQQRLQEGRRAQLENIGSETFYDSDGNKKTFSEAGVMQYASYDFGTQTITIDWSAIDAITDTDKGEAVEAYIGRLEELQEQFEDTQETLEEMQDELEEIKERGKEEYLDFEQKVYDAIVERQQQIIDDFQDLSDDINDANSKILDDLQKSIELQRQIRDNTETEEDIADKEARLAYLQRDTSGANASEILRLQQEIEDARQDYQDTLIDQELDRLNDVNETANEQRERQIEIMQSQLDWDEKNGAFWEETYGLIQGALNEDGSFNRNSDLVKLLADTDAFKGMSDFGKLNWIGELIQQFNEAQQGYSNWMVDRVSKEGTEINAVDAQGNSVELTYKDGKWTQGDDTYSVEYDATSKSYVAKKNEKAKTIEEYTQGTGAATTTKKSTSGSSNSEDKKGYYTADYLSYYFDSNTGKIKSNKGTSFSIISQDDANTRAQKAETDTHNKAKEAYLLWKNDNGDTNLPFGGGGKVVSTSYLAYATGGLNTETGPAWLDGTPSKPEYVLNATQTEAFLKLTKVLPDLLGGNSTTTTRGGDTYYDVKFIVDEMSSDYDVDQLWERFKQKIYEDGSYRNTTVINRLR